MAKKVHYTEIVKRLKYKPKWISDPELDHVVVIAFRDYKGFSASIEFGQTLYNRKAHDFYFERVDWNGYTDGDFIPLNSDKRHDVIHVNLTPANLDMVCEAVNARLKKHYAKKA